MNLKIQEELNLKQLMPSINNLNAMSNFFYAFSDSTRLLIIILLSIKPLCVGEIVSVSNFNQTTVSHQLKILKSLNIVGSNRAGKNIIYYIKNVQILDVLNAGVECI